MKRHIVALDGIRGLAISLVFAHHLRILEGSRVGSEIFFVLSGFLITKNLRSRPRYGRKITIINFLKRRASRLMPGFAALTFFSAAICFLDVNDRYGFKRSLVAAITLSMNWQRAFSNWEGGALAHLWSLAAEQQFYFFWPVAFFLIPYAFTRSMLIALLLMSVVWRLILCAHGAGIERIFNGLDTHPDGLVVGCLMATIDLEFAKGRLAQASGLVIILILVILTRFFHTDNAWVFSLATLCIAIMSAFVIAVLMQEGLLSKILSTQPLPIIGTISYGIYLWHLPVIVLFNPNWAHGIRLSQIGITILLGFTSYYLIERPALRWSIDQPSKRARDPAPEILHET